MLGKAFMGRVHSNGYDQIKKFFPELNVTPIKQAVCATKEQELKAFANQFDWKHIELNWKNLVNRKDIDVFDNCGPNYLHKDPVILAAENGKHVLCEKPLAINLNDAREMVNAVEKADVINMTSFNYRRIPAIWFARNLIEQGKIGRIFHFRGVYLQDWLIDPKFPFTWRLDKNLAGSGVHGDLNAHIIDLAHYLIGDIQKVIGVETTFIKKRILHGSNEKSNKFKDVLVDDATNFLTKFENGALGTFEATRFATGRKNFLSFEINGSKGSMHFNLERLNELNFLDNNIPESGFKKILVTESNHKYIKNWWPPGHVLGWEHSHIFQIKDFLEAINTHQKIIPNLRDGAKVQAVLEAVTNSISKEKWEHVQTI